MAAAASGVAALPWPNAERATSSFSKSAHSQIRIPHRPFPIQTLRRSDFNPKCEMRAEKPVQTATSRSLRSSALELLKTSSADSEFSSQFNFYYFSIDSRDCVLNW